MNSKNMIVGFASLAFALSSSVSNAALEAITINSHDSLPAHRWAYGVGKAPADANDPAAQLARVKQAQVEEDFGVCVDRARGARAIAKSLGAWLAINEIECATKLKPSVANAGILSRALEDADGNPSWFLTGPGASKLRQTYAQGRLALMDQDVKVNRARAWRSVEKLQPLAPYLDDKINAALYRDAGEITFIQQKFEAARDYMKRSLALQDSEEVRGRLAVIEASLNPVKPGATPAATPISEAATENVEASKDELELVERATIALKAGDFVSAVGDLVKLINEFPGGTRAKWASDRVQETLASVDRNDPKYQDVRDKVLARAEKVDADRLILWATTAYNRGAFGDAHRFAKKSLESVDGVRRTRALEMAGESAIATDHWNDAEKAFTELIEKSAGQPAAREAMLRLGLLKYRQAKYTEAVTHFERLLALPQIENHEVTARYWLWRSLQKSKSERATAASDELMTRFPFSYYGLRARAEQGKGVLEWKSVKKDEANVQSKIWVTANERLAWERTQMLLRAGWLDEAQSEIRELPPALRAEDKAVRALVWAAAGGYVSASRLANEGWDEKSEYRRAPFTDAAFPREFTDFITAQSSARNVDRDLVRGLIKQESSFNVKAVSTSNAYGLMQMIPPTAREIAGDLKLGTLKLPDDMFNPDRNIKMGTYYLSRMITKYSGYVPMGLAAYNAGPGRMDRWIRSRPSLRNLTSVKSSNPDEEVWIDEIPYSETCFYVKAILRNVMLYRLLDKGRVEITDPIWAFNQVK